MAHNWIKEGDVPRVMIPTAMFPGLILGLPAARVYAALAMRANNASGLVDSTREQIGEDAQLSLTQVRTGLKLLIDNGWVTQVRQGNSRISSKYRMHASPVEVSTVDRVDSRPVKGAETRPVKGADSRPVQTADEVADRAEIRPEQGGNPAQTGRKSAPPLVSPPSCLPKDLSTTGGTTYPPAEAEASRAEESEIFDAELVDEEGQNDGLFVADPAPPAGKTKTASKRKGKGRERTPAEEERSRQAQHLTKSYYDSMAGMTSFPGVLAIVTTALGRFSYDRVRDGVKHLAEVDRNRPFTRQTLLNAIEATAAGSAVPASGRVPARPVGLPNLSTGDRRLVEGEWLKTVPDWALLAQLGVTPQNAHHFGWQQPA